MCWISSPIKYVNIAAYAQYELGSPKGCHLLERSIKKGVVYSLYENEEKTERYIIVDRVEKHDGLWGHKSMNESVGPCYYECPDHILKRSTCMEQYAVQWREKCHTHKAELRDSKKQVSELFRKLNKGQLVKMINGVHFEFVRVYNKTATQIVCKTDTGEVYRYSPNQIDMEFLKELVSNSNTRELAQAAA